jgi:hypothetical protein
VQFALGVEELHDDDPLFEAVRGLAEDCDKTNED